MSSGLGRIYYLHLFIIYSNKSSDWIFFSLLASHAEATVLHAVWCVFVSSAFTLFYFFRIFLLWSLSTSLFGSSIVGSSSVSCTDGSKWHRNTGHFHFALYFYYRPALPTWTHYTKCILAFRMCAVWQFWSTSSFLFEYVRRTYMRLVVWYDIFCALALSCALYGRIAHTPDGIFLLECALCMLKRWVDECMFWL